jgi:hypothetical protein
MKKIIFLFFLFCSTSVALNAQNCCRGYKQIGSCGNLIGSWFKIGLVCGNTGGGGCQGYIFDSCSGNSIPITCSGVSFSSSFAVSCFF